MTDLERAARAASALRENGYGEYSTREYLRHRYELDLREIDDILARLNERSAVAVDLRTLTDRRPL